MSQLSNHAENKLADMVRGQAWTLAANLYMGLASAADDGSVTELVGTGYARVAVARSLANWAGTQGAGTTLASTGTSHASSNNNAIDWGTSGAAWGTANFVTMHDASTSGNVVAYLELSDPLVINLGDPVQVAAGELDVGAGHVAQPDVADLGPARRQALDVGAVALGGADRPAAGVHAVGQPAAQPLPERHPPVVDAATTTGLGQVLVQPLLGIVLGGVSATGALRAALDSCISDVAWSLGAPPPGAVRLPARRHCGALAASRRAGHAAGASLVGEASRHAASVACPTRPIWRFIDSRVGRLHCWFIGVYC